MEGDFIACYEMDRDSFEIYQHKDDKNFSVVHYRFDEEAESFIVTSYTRALEKILSFYKTN